MTTQNPSPPPMARPALRKYTFRIRFQRAHTRVVSYHGTDSMDAREIALSALTDAHKAEVVQVTCIGETA